MNQPSHASEVSTVPRPLAPAPSSGVLRVRVRYCECDPMGVAHHAAYIPWLEMARTELLRGTGVSYADLEAAGVLLVVIKLDIAYRRPARHDDLVDVRTRVVGGKYASRVKIRHEYEVVRAAESTPAREQQLSTQAGPGELANGAGEVLCTATSLLACVDRRGRPRALPEWLVASE